MNAAVYTKFNGEIKVQRVEKPQLDPTNEDHKDSIIVQVKATGVCRSDWVSATTTVLLFIYF